MSQKKKQSSSNKYALHLVRAIIAFTAVTMLSWAVWKLLDYFLFPNSTLTNAAVAGVIAVVVLAVDHFHLREIE